jgi:hypothetical protein
VWKIVAFLGIVAGGMFFCLRTIFAFLSFCMCVADFETAKKTQRNGEKNQEPKMRNLKRRKKLETAKI